MAFWNLFRKKNSDVTFSTLPPQPAFTLDNQDGPCRNVTEATIREYLQLLTEDPDQFVVLTAPAMQNNMRFIQACPVPDGFVLQIAVGEPTRLYERICTFDQLYPDFLAFFHSSFQPDWNLYQPVEFP